MARDLRPGDEEIEVTVFGPGYGESILVHLGYGNWLIVDCCEDQHTRELPVLAYLDKLEVSPSQVRLVVATHWHDDHVRGLGRLVAECSRADFACSLALKDREFVALTRVEPARTIDKSPLGTRRSGVAEMRAVFEEFDARIRGRRPGHVRGAIADRPLIVRNDGGMRAAVTALSPSDDSVMAALREFSRFFEVGADARRRFRSNKNHASVVLWVAVGDVALLLGADLVKTRKRTTGWDGVLEHLIVPQETRADLFKVPHHGSPNADHPDVWARMVVDKCVAVVSPWQLADDRRPRAADLARLCGNAGTLYITAPADPTGSTVTTETTGNRIVGEQTRAGRVTLRRPATTPGSWEVELVDPAHCPCKSPLPAAEAV